MFVYFECHSFGLSENVALLTRRLKASRSSIVSVSAFAITGTMLTHLSNLFMNSTSIGLNLQDTKADKRIKERQNHREMTFFERQLLRTSNSLYIAHSDVNFQRLSLYQKITILLRIVPYTLISIRNGVMCIPFFTNFIKEK